MITTLHGLVKSHLTFRTFTPRRLAGRVVTARVHVVLGGSFRSKTETVSTIIIITSTEPKFFEAKLKCAINKGQ